MKNELLRNPKALAVSIGLHVIIIGLIAFEFAFTDKPELVRTGPVEETVQAEVVDIAVLEQREAEKAAEEAAAEAEAQRLAEEQQEQEEARKLAEAKKKAEEEAAKKEEEAKVAEAKQPVVPTPTPTPRPATPKPGAQQAEKPPEAPKVRRGDVVEFGPGVVMPKSKRAPTPKYPEMARRFNKTSATVLVRALIDENGEVIKAELASKPQKFGFDQEAISAVKKSTYEPATKYGVPVKFWHTITVQFKK